jgi:hypothetical protein
MHTNHPHYEQSFNEIVSQREQGKLLTEPKSPAAKSTTNGSDRKKLLHGI